MMTHGYDQVPAPHQQCYQDNQLSQQFGGLSLQDPAFLQELQRIENQKYYQPQVLPPAGPGQHVDPMYAHNTGPGPGQAAPMQQNMVPVGSSSLPSVPMGGGSTGTDQTLRHHHQWSWCSD